MRCQHHSDRPCNECDEHLVECNDCEHLDCDGDCYNSESERYCDFMEGLVVCCGLFEKRK